MQSIRGDYCPSGLVLKRDDTVFTEVYQNRYAFSSPNVCGECGTNFRRQNIYIEKPYEKIQWCCYQHIKDSKKCSQKAVREDVIQAAFLTLWNRLASNYEEILIPMLAALKAIQGNPEQDREMQEIEQNIRLKCYIVIELKAVSFEPEFAGKLNFYVNAVNELIRTPDENPTIGLLICKDKEQTEVQWAFQGIQTPMGIAAYDNIRLEEIKKQLPTEKQIQHRIE